MRRKIVAANWKMNKLFTEAENLILAIADELESDLPAEAIVVICPPYPYLELATDIAQESHFCVGAQNVHSLDSGAYTGEVSAAMLASMKVEFCIIGHSERRKYFNEENVFLYDKVKAALQHDIIPIFCCGELLSEREAKKHKAVVKSQLETTVFQLEEKDFLEVVIAYEPVWAIGTGVNASPEQAQEMHSYIRSLIAKRYGKTVANETSLLYGGSCNAANAASLFSQKDVDGGLIGGASLKEDEFMAIVRAL